MDLPLAPIQASTFAPEVDAIYYVLWALTILFSVLVFSAVMFLAIRYRRGSRVNRKNPSHSDLRLELLWSIIPLLLGLVVFFWNANLYFRTRRPPANATEIFVIGKRWMWHIQHANGVRENNELHVPVGVPIKLTMISQDVIHSFFMPEFRIKQDVLPGRYTQQWFTATRPGKYHLFCSQYCGTQHSEMTGTVTVMEPREFQKWLNNGGENPTPQMATMEGAGEALFTTMGCKSCHAGSGTPRGGSLTGLYRSTVALANGERIEADDAYLRESILKPNEKVVKGFWPVMPAYAGQLDEEQVLKLLAYIKSLETGRWAPAPGESQPKESGR